MPGFSVAASGGYVKTLLEPVGVSTSFDWDTLRDSTGGKNFVVTVIGGGGGGEGSSADGGPGGSTVFDVSLIALGGDGGEDATGSGPGDQGFYCGVEGSTA